MTLAEFLTYRAKTTPWLPALREKLRTVLFEDCDDLKQLSGVQFLGDALATAAQFKAVAADLLAPRWRGHRANAPMHQLARVNLL